MGTFSITILQFVTSKEQARVSTRHFSRRFLVLFPQAEMLQKPVENEDEALSFRLHFAQTVTILGKGLQLSRDASRFQGFVELDALRRRDAEILEADQNEGGAADAVHVRNRRPRNQLLVMLGGGHDAGAISRLAPAQLWARIEDNTD